MPDTITRTVVEQDWLSPVEERLQVAIRRAYDEGTPTCRAIERFLHGEWLGHPLHAALTDIPVGAWTVAAALDGVEAATGNRTAGAGADGAIAVGLAGAAASAAAGWTDWSRLGGAARRIGLVHGLANMGVTAMYAASLVLRKRNARAAGRTVAALAFGIAGLAAYLGGTLVYKERVGVAEGTEEKPSPALGQPEIEPVP